MHPLLPQNDPDDDEEDEIEALMRLCASASNTEKTPEAEELLSILEKGFWDYDVDGKGPNEESSQKEKDSDASAIPTTVTSSSRKEYHHKKVLNNSKKDSSSKESSTSLPRQKTTTSSTSRKTVDKSSSKKRKQSPVSHQTQHRKSILRTARGPHPGKERNVNLGRTATTTSAATTTTTTTTSANLVNTCKSTNPSATNVHSNDPRPKHPNTLNLAYSGDEEDLRILESIIEQDSPENPSQGASLTEIFEKDQREYEREMKRKQEEKQRRAQQLERKKVEENNRRLMEQRELNRKAHLPFHPLHSKLFPHQLEGVRFLFLNLSNDKGCMLCDHMGLGKTITALSYIAQFCLGYHRKYDRQRVLILVPTSVFGHWTSEIEKVNNWLSESRCINIALHSLSSSVASSDRLRIIESWYKQKTVLLMTYGLFRSMTLTHRTDDEAADLLCMADYVFLDEGHRIKNTESQLSQALQNMETTKRVVCTGYPMQNNLTEYWALVNFCRPSFLGSIEDFRKLYMDPIEDGVTKKSTLHRKHESRGRAWVLHDSLKPFVLRRGVSVLKETLPEKHEIILMVHPTATQRNIINRIIEEIQGMGAVYFWIYNIMGICLNHPDILVTYLSKRQKNLLALSKQMKEESNLRKLKRLMSDEDYVEPETPADEDKEDGLPLGTATNSTPTITRSSRSASNMHADTESDEDASEIELLYLLERRKVRLLQKVLKGYKTGNLSHSNKMLILFSLIFQCKYIGEKLVVFSKSLTTLNFIQDCIIEHNYRHSDSPISFVRLDGSTYSLKRAEIVKKFNEEDINVALISTLAGGEGINLYSANRMVIMDVNYNPSHDVEAQCRIYRYGQTREVYIYRLIGHQTAEKRTINSQLRKERLSGWIVDNNQVDVSEDADYGITKLIPENYEETTVLIPDEFDSSADPLLENILEKFPDKLYTVNLHDNLLYKNSLLHLSTEDKNRAKQQISNTTAKLPSSDDEAKPEKPQFMEAPASLVVDTRRRISPLSPSSTVSVMTPSTVGTNATPSTMATPISQGREDASHSCDDTQEKHRKRKRDSESSNKKQKRQKL